MLNVGLYWRTTVATLAVDYWSLLFSIDNSRFREDESSSNIDGTWFWQNVRFVLVICAEVSYESLVWNMLISQLPSKNPGNFQVTLLANQNEIVKVLIAVWTVLVRHLLHVRQDSWEVWTALTKELFQVTQDNCEEWSALTKDLFQVRHDSGKCALFWSRSCFK